MTQPAFQFPFSFDQWEEHGIAPAVGTLWPFENVTAFVVTDPGLAAVSIDAMDGIEFLPAGITVRAFDPRKTGGGKFVEFSPQYLQTLRFHDEVLLLDAHPNDANERFAWMRLEDMRIKENEVLHGYFAHLNPDGSTAGYTPFFDGGKAGVQSYEKWWSLHGQGWLTLPELLGSLEIACTLEFRPEAYVDEKVLASLSRLTRTYIPIPRRMPPIYRPVTFDEIARSPFFIPFLKDVFPFMFDVLLACILSDRARGAVAATLFSETRPSVPVLTPERSPSLSEIRRLDLFCGTVLPRQAGQNTYFMSLLARLTPRAHRFAMRSMLSDDARRAAATYRSQNAEIVAGD